MNQIEINDHGSYLDGIVELVKQIEQVKSDISELEFISFIDIGNNIPRDIDKIVITTKEDQGGDEDISIINSGFGFRNEFISNFMKLEHLSKIGVLTTDNTRKIQKSFVSDLLLIHLELSKIIESAIETKRNKIGEMERNGIE